MGKGGTGGKFFCIPSTFQTSSLVSLMSGVFRRYLKSLLKSIVKQTRRHSKIFGYLSKTHSFLGGRVERLREEEEEK